MKKSNQDQCIGAGVAAAAAERNDSEEKPPAYLKLIADCWENIFAYLSLWNILLMGQTCKRMNRMAGYYIREYYPQLEFELINGKVYMQGVCLQAEFYSFIGRLVISGLTNNTLAFLSNANTFDALKTIEFCDSNLSETQIEYISKALKNVENIEVNKCKIVDNVFAQLANCCPKLKQMKISYNMSKVALLYSQYYPNLECLRYWPLDYPRFDELKTFLEKHSKLKQFHINFTFLMAYRHVLIQTNIQLDLLNVRFSELHRFILFDTFIEFLKTLYDRNFYKTLQFSLNECRIDREYMSHTISSLPTLEKLYTLNDFNLDLARFTNLRELQIHEFKRTNIETLAKSLSKLEQLVINSAKIETILPFIRHSKNLKAIKISDLRGSGLDLLVLNKERTELENACKVSIYVKDYVYLYPKWKSHNFNLELDLVKIARFDLFMFDN